MNCAQVKEQLVDFLYGELPAPARASFEDHLRGCPGCSTEVAAHRRTLGETRTALTGPLLQEPPARVRLAILDAAKQAARTKATSEEAPGFFARLWRAPWLMPAFGAASVATVVLLVRVLKDPEIVPGQRGRSVEETALVAPPPVPPPAPVVAPSEQAAAEPLKPADKTTAGQSMGRMAAPRRKLKQGSADGLSGLGSISAGAGASERFAQPPPPRSAGPAGGIALDDLLRARKDDRNAAPSAEAKAASSLEEQSYGKPPVMAKPAVGKKSAEHAPAAASETVGGLSSPPSDIKARPAPAQAAPPPPPPAPVAAPASAPTPSYAAPPSKAARRSSAKSEADDEAAAREPAERELSKEKAAGGAAKGGLSVEEMAKRADRLFSEQQWGAATAAYRDLINHFPSHKEAPKWRERLGQSVVAEQQARKRDEAKKTVDEVLKDSK